MDKLIPAWKKKQGEGRGRYLSLPAEAGQARNPLPLPGYLPSFLINWLL
jgi:hypothetical protein